MIQKLHTRRGGFTLVEIMIVVAIIALLAAIAVPSFLRARKRSQATRILEDLRLIDAATDQYAVDTGKTSGFNPSWSDLQNYLKTGTVLYSTGADIFGDSYGTAFTVDMQPTVPANAYATLSDVAPAPLVAVRHALRPNARMSGQPGGYLRTGWAAQIDSAPNGISQAAGAQSGTCGWVGRRVAGVWRGTVRALFHGRIGAAEYGGRSRQCLDQLPKDIRQNLVLPRPAINSCNCPKSIHFWLKAISSRQAICIPWRCWMARTKSAASSKES